MFDGELDPTTSAGVASAALEQSLATLRQVLVQAGIVNDAATAVAASQTAIAAWVAAVGIDHRWTGTSVEFRLPDGSYGAKVNLKGDEGDPGPAPVLQTGTVTVGTSPGFTFHNEDPANPIVDVVLPSGLNGWSPVYAKIADGGRIVDKLVDWQGGQGAKPTVGLYTGSTGLVTDVAAATDVRGAPGSVTGSGTPAAGDLAIWQSSTVVQGGAPITAFGKSVVAAATAAALKTILAIAAGDVSGLGTAAVLAAGTAAGNVPVLDGSGKLLSSLLPAVAITDSFPVASQAAMLALTAQRGDIAIRSDIRKSFALSTDDPTTLANWLELLTPTDLVQAVAGLTGVITAAALKTALAPVLADITDASANGRSLVAAANYAAMRTLLGLGGAALLSVGTTTGTVAAGDDSRIVAAGLAVADVAYNSQDIRALYLINAGQAGIDRLNGIATIADSYADQSDINTGASTGQTYDGTNKWYVPTLTVGPSLSGGATGLSGGDAASHAAALAFDGNNTTYWQASQAAGSTSGVAYIGAQFSSPVAPSQVTVLNAGVANAAPSTVKIDCSDDGAAWTNVIASAALTTTSGASTTLAIPFVGYHLYWRVMATANPTNVWSLAELTFNDSVFASMSLISAAFPSDIASPTKGRLLVQVSSAASSPISLNTDLVASVSRNGGANVTAGTLAYVETMADGTKTYETGLIDISAQPAGSSMAYKVATANNKRVAVSGAVLQWRP